MRFGLLLLLGALASVSALREPPTQLQVGKFLAYLIN